jgi:hypothetical protein
VKYILSTNKHFWTKNTVVFRCRNYSRLKKKISEYILSTSKHFWKNNTVVLGAGKNSKSSKVFSTLSWSWSFKSMQANKESSSDAGGYGYHGKTLDKIYDEEQKLYKLVKVRYGSLIIIMV